MPARKKWAAGDYLKDIRTQAGLSQHALAHKARTGSQGYVSKVERGDFTDVTIEMYASWIRAADGDYDHAADLWWASTKPRVREKVEALATLSPAGNSNIPGSRSRLSAIAAIRSLSSVSPALSAAAA